MLGTSKGKRDNKGFELFITTAPIPNLNEKVIVFGRVVKGEDVVQVTNDWNFLLFVMMCLVLCIAKWDFIEHELRLYIVAQQPKYIYHTTEIPCCSNWPFRIDMDKLCLTLVMFSLLV